ncbi:MAG: right-handed parallel beta-helix repeat-containing protein, partial [Planctomycetota bacterium]
AGGADDRYLLEFNMATMQEGTTAGKIVDDNLPDKDCSGATAWVSSHKRWFCWTGPVTGFGQGYLEIVNNADSKGNQVCKRGGKYYVFGSLDLLDTGDEWYYDDRSHTLYVQLPRGGAPGNRVEVKKREGAFDLRGTSHVAIRGLDIFAASIVTDDRSDNLVFDDLEIRYVHHSSRAEQQYGSQTRSGMILQGRGHTVKNCEIAYSSGNCMTLAGEDCRVVNNYIHDGDYIGSYAAPLCFSRGGRGHVVSHNTITRSGRTTINTAGFHDCLLQYNDVGYAGYLSDDLGLTYGNGVEGGNSEVRYNWFHDNISDSHNMGLYFDHGCKNIVFHHNCIWGANHAGMINNQYGNYLLYYNNTVSGVDPSYLSTWAAAQKKDLYGCRLVNNLGSGGTRVKAQGLEISHNTWKYDKLIDHRYLTPGTSPVDSGMVVSGITDDYVGEGPDRGAYELGGHEWKPGHDFQTPPAEMDMGRSRAPYRNLIQNAAFYNGEIAPWEVAGQRVKIVEDFHSQWVTDGKAMMGGYSARLGSGQNALRQTVKGLKPNATYELMAMFRVPQGEEARLRVSQFGGQEKRSQGVVKGAPEWRRRKLQFTTGPENTSAVVWLERTSGGDDPVYVDDPGLRLVDAAKQRQRKVRKK